MQIGTKPALFKKSIFSIRVGSPAGKSSEWDWHGTGSTVYADEKRTLILTAAHIACPGQVIRAKSAEGREFCPRLLPGHDQIADLALLEARSSDIGEILPTFPIAAGYDRFQTSFSAIGFSSPDILEAINIRGIGLILRKSCSKDFFYLCGDVELGFSGAPLFETGRTEILGLISGKLHSSVLYGPSYGTIRYFVSLAIEHGGK